MRAAVRTQLVRQLVSVHACPRFQIQLAPRKTIDKHRNRVASVAQMRQIRANAPDSTMLALLKAQRTRSEKTRLRKR